ncbi:MAG: DUF342 domain-containing protein [Phycisphaerales bacterium]|nr:DUF342 domain-containing protein [Phycisphaerales bacterium]
MNAQRPPTGVKLVVSQDKLCAELVAGGDKAPSQEQCLARLYEAELRVEPKLVEAVREFCEQWTQGQPSRLPVRRGKAPINGADGRIDWLVRSPEEPAPLPPPVEGDSAEGAGVDHYARSVFILVKKGEELGNLVQPTPGEDGIDVFGLAIAAKPGRPIKIKFDDSILVESNGRLSALCEGVLSIANGKAAVRKLLQIDSFVDFNTGHIDFDGDVVIAKGVRDLFKVVATGSITIGGLVEAATLHAGGDIILTGGMAGREQGEIRAGGDLIARFIDGVTGEIDGALRIEREVMNCKLTVHGGIKSPNAKIMGGALAVRGPVDVSVIGGPAAHTDLTIGPSAEELAKMGELAKALAHAKVRHTELSTESQHLAARGARMTPAQRERQTELQYELFEADRVMNETLAQHAEIEELARTAVVDVTVHRQLFGASAIHIAGATFKLRQDIGGPFHLSSHKGEPMYRMGQRGEPVLLRAHCHARAAAA